MNGYPLCCLDEQLNTKLENTISLALFNVQRGFSFLLFPFYILLSVVLILLEADLSCQIGSMSSISRLNSFNSLSTPMFLITYVMFCSFPFFSNIFSFPPRVATGECEGTAVSLFSPHDGHQKQHGKRVY